jgi:hypothetical protein
VKATDKIDRIISIHENNVGQLSAALASARRDVELSEDVKTFLLSLAKSSIVLAASHDPVAKQKRKPRVPKEDKVEKADKKHDKKPRVKGALAAAASAAADAQDA